MVPEQLVRLLLIVGLFLVIEYLSLSFLFTNLAIQLLEKFFDFIGSDLRLVHHHCSLLSEGSEAGHDFLHSGVLARLRVQA